MKKHLPTVLLILVFLAGVSLLLYPSVSDWWNARHQSRAITNYAAEVAQLDNDIYEQIWADAKAWNEKVYQKGWGLNLPEEEKEGYEATLNVSGSGVMAYIEIPKINCSLPIYHGTNEGVLQTSIGHIEGSSLPVGGENTHCVLSGHRGLPSARLFTDLDQLVVGDTFLIHTLDETLTYEVDQILIVLPHEVSALAIEEGKDLCTLVTCTPYGVNSHRLLVRGHRIDTEEEAAKIRVSGDAVQLESSTIAPLVAVPILLILLIVLLVSTRRRKR